MTVFADTSYFIALIAPNDVAHSTARHLSQQNYSLVTTAWVMTELAAFLAAPSNRILFTRVWHSVQSHPSVELVQSDQRLFEEGVELYSSRADKAWSLVDCISFVVMQQRSLIDALTGDRHFMQAGFNALLAMP